MLDGTVMQVGLEVIGYSTYEKHISNTMIKLDRGNLERNVISRHIKPRKTASFPLLRPNLHHSAIYTASSVGTQILDRLV